MKPSKLLIASLMAAAPAFALAQGTTGMTHEQFNHIDTDGSGTISEVEYYRFMEGAFVKLDTDGNNTLEETETTNILTPDQFTKVDVNEDRRISREEFLGHVMSEFHYHDNNKNGELTP